MRWDRRKWLNVTFWYWEAVLQAVLQLSLRPGRQIGHSRGKGSYGEKRVCGYRSRSLGVSLYEPCSQVTPEEIAEAYVEEQDYYSNGIAHYTLVGKAMTECWM